MLVREADRTHINPGRAQFILRSSSEKQHLYYCRDRVSPGKVRLYDSENDGAFTGQSQLSIEPAFVDSHSYCIYNNTMTYEWDEGKRRVNLKRHGLDFVDSPLVYAQPDKLTACSPRSGEGRKMDIATVKGLALTLVYTERPEAVRIISFRRSSRRERRQYDEYQRIS